MKPCRRVHPRRNESLRSARPIRSKPAVEPLASLSMKIAAVSCANGLGHLKRSIRILNAAVDRFSPAAITLFCDRSGVEQIVGWNEYIVLQQRCTVNTIPVTLPGRWKQSLELNRVWLSDWHTSMRDWKLQEFDFVISDNFVEPLLYSD